MNEILVVDDERVLREGLKAMLEGEGFTVRAARDGEEALRRIGERRPDLVLLDVMMPKMNGFRCCEEIRKTEELLPVVFLTAKASEADQVRGLGLGADDYVSKDAGESLLLARINRAIERASVFRKGSGNSSCVRIGSVIVDLESNSVNENGREVARLTRTEGDLLKLFVTRRNEFLTPDEIVGRLRGNGFACEDAMIYMHISNLRRKLGPSAAMIVTRHGVGYGFIQENLKKV